MKKLTIILSALLCLCIFSCTEKDDDAVLNRPIKLKHEAVDLGLPSGLLWATCNVGANSPEEYGDYFAWGETEPKDTYDWSNYKWCEGFKTMTKYCYESWHGTIDNKTELDPEDDAAHVNWDDDWRMPTEAEQRELKNNCTWTWTTKNEINGYKVTGPNGKSIFLPAAGYWLGDVGVCGRYWSCSLSYSDCAECLSFFSSGSKGMTNPDRYEGRSVRAVRSPK